jgi:hypothetical protein
MESSVESSVAERGAATAEKEGEPVTLTKEVLAEAIDIPTDQWEGACHAISLAAVRSGLFEGGRVARGFAAGVASQHSWVTLGDPYEKDVTIIDPTLWAYVDSVYDVFMGSLRDGIHHPHGEGSIWDWGRPTASGGEIIEADTAGLSTTALDWLNMLGPLDWMGWNQLLSQAPVGGWPASEIVTWAAGIDKLSPIIPIDRKGMLTDLNPNDLYW